MKSNGPSETISKHPHWKLYSEPVELALNTTIRAKAIRLGYKASPEASLKVPG